MGFYWLEFLRGFADKAGTEAVNTGHPVENGGPAVVESEAGVALRSLTRPAAPMRSTRAEAVLGRRLREQSQRRLWGREDGFTMAGPRR